jgi:hypothetical protein
MEPTSPQSFGSTPSPANGAAHSDNTSPVDATFSTTAAHATGDTPYPTDSPAQPAASGVKAKLDDALESGKKWLSNSGVADQAQQLPQKAKDLGTKAWTSVSGLTTTQKAVSVGVLAAGVAFLLTRGKGKKSTSEYRDKPRKSPFDHQPSTRDGDHAYDRKGQRPWGASRYGTSPTPPKPAGKGRPLAGSGHTPPDHGHTPDHGRPAPLHRSASAGGAPTPGPRRDQGPATGSQYDAKTSGSQNPNNLG